MNSIKNIAVIGAGALGLMYMESLKETEELDAYFLSDRERNKSLSGKTFSINGREVSYKALTPEMIECAPDLVLLCVKNHQLESVAPLLTGICGPGTIVLSVLNGISSESWLQSLLPRSIVLYCVVLGMDAVKEGDALTYSRKGKFIIGTEDNRETDELKETARFLVGSGLPCELAEDILKELWFKWMINIGINQPSALIRAPYKAFQTDGPARDLMDEAMNETIAVAEAEGINLNSEDIERWYAVLKTLGPEGKTSMLQDMEAGRKTEVDSFAGELIRRAEKRGVAVPVNRTLYRLISARDALL